MRVAWVGPLPPEESGIADYSAELLPALARRVEVEVFTSERALAAGEAHGAAELHPYHELPRESARFDTLLHQIGNDVRFHGDVYRLALEHPGVAVLHEFGIHDLVRGVTAGEPGAYLEAVFYSYGEAGVAAAARAADEGRELASADYPLFERLVDASLGVLVHSRYACERILDSRPCGRVEVVPHHLSLGGRGPVEGEELARLRSRLGLEPGGFLVGCFGMLTASKCLDVALAAFQRLARGRPDARLVLAGEPAPGYDLRAELGEVDPARVTLTGRLPLDGFLDCMRAVDVVINLRASTAGETSGALVRAMGLARPVIVSDAGSFAGLPAGSACKVAPGPNQTDEVAGWLDRLARRPELARSIGERARAYALATGSLEASAAGYERFLARVAGKSSR